jgi:hypothetical protein
MDPIDSLDSLSAAFARLDARVPWVRVSACFDDAGRPLMFGFGRPNDEGDAPTAGLKDPAAVAAVMELHALADDAGRFVEELRASGRCTWTPVVESAGPGPTAGPSVQWLMFLLGTSHLWRAPGSPGRRGPVVWFDAYPQVCVTALAWLRGRLATDDPGPQHVTQPQAAVLKVMLRHHPALVTVAVLGRQIAGNEKTVGGYVAGLQESQLVTPPADKGGRGLTPAGVALARSLPPDAGGAYLRKRPARG